MKDQGPGLVERAGSACQSQGQTIGSSRGAVTPTLAAALSPEQCGIKDHVSMTGRDREGGDHRTPRRRKRKQVIQKQFTSKVGLTPSA